MRSLIPARPAWWANAACAPHPTAWWFPTQGQSAQHAKSICADCPELHTCHDWALEQGPWLQGIFAGLNQHDRTRIRRGAA